GFVLSPPGRLAAFGAKDGDGGEVPVCLADQALDVLPSERFGGHGRTLPCTPNRPLTALTVHTHTAVLQKSHGIPDPGALGGRRGRPSDPARPAALARTARVSVAARERAGSGRPARRPAVGRDCAEDRHRVAAELRVAIAEIDRRLAASARVRRIPVTRR